MGQSTGSISIENSTFTGNSLGLRANAFRGNLSITGALFDRNGAGVLKSLGSETSVTLECTTITNSTRGNAVDAWLSPADWTIRNTTISDNTGGINARGTLGDWSISWSEITGSENTRRFYRIGFGEGIAAVNSSGDWEIRQNSIANHEGANVNATAANTDVNATQNWWGSSDRICLGPVDCSSSLDEMPEISAGDAGAPPLDGEFPANAESMVSGDAGHDESESKNDRSADTGDDSAGETAIDASVHSEDETESGQLPAERDEALVILTGVIVVLALVITGIHRLSG